MAKETDGSQTDRKKIKTLWIMAIKMAEPISEKQLNLFIISAREKRFMDLERKRNKEVQV